MANLVPAGPPLTGRREPLAASCQATGFKNLAPARKGLTHSFIQVKLRACTNMISVKLYFNLARLGLVIGLGFFSNLLFDLEIRAQPSVSLAGTSGLMPVVTNLSQLAKLTKSPLRTIAEVRLDVLVCSTSRADIGVVAVMDKTGCEILELGPGTNSITPGNVLHIEGQHCFLRRRELGIEVTLVPELDNDGTHGLRQVAGAVRLTAGIHPFQLDYFNYVGAYGLTLTCQLPDGTVKPAENFLVRPGGGDGHESKMVAGLNATYYDGAWLNIPDFALLQPLKSVTATNLNPDYGASSDMTGIRYQGFFTAPVDGNYLFNLASDDGSLLFLDGFEISLKKTGQEEVPPPIVASLPAAMTDIAAAKWMCVEGRANFVSRSGRGVSFELRSQTDSIWVLVADSGEMDPNRLLNERIRVTGVGRAVITSTRNPVLGELTVATAKDLTILGNAEGMVAGSGPVRTLVEVGQIQSLSKDEAARHLPVRIQGVVTSRAPPSFHYMTVQDETRGIFVRQSALLKSTPYVGQFCELAGYTDTGDFAPIVVAEDVTILGKGRMPPPARPTWNELINGSMDIQWVEYQGLVMGVHSNSLAIFLPEGELNVEVGAYSEAQLRTLAGSVIRLRGVLFAAWNTNRTVEIGHLVMRNVTFGIDARAPVDPFDVPVKNWNELYQFDSRATPFQRVKVSGVVTYADFRRVFLADSRHGIRVLTVQAPDVRFGDEVEVVGYPEISGPAPLLREAVVRKTGRSTGLNPLIFDGNETNQEACDSMLVRISATLMGIHAEPESRVLEMNAGGHLFLARLPDTGADNFLRLGSQLALTGVLVGKVTDSSEASRPSGFELLMSSPDQVTLLSKPSWWTSRRLLIIVGILLAILILSVVWISQLRRLVEQRTRELQKETREREMAEREQALETERSRIARDLHDDLGSSLTEISVLATKGQRIEAPGDLTGMLRAISAKARGLVSALDIIVWAVDPKDNSLESVADYLGDFASEYLSHSGIACRFDIPVALPAIVLEGRSRHGLLLAVKETLNNIERHAQATEVEFRLTCSGGRLEIIITDNGKGFDTKSRRAGNGLKNLPLRLSKLGGGYLIESSPGKGTTVIIALNLPSRIGVACGLP